MTATIAEGWLRLKLLCESKLEYICVRCNHTQGKYVVPVDYLFFSIPSWNLHSQFQYSKPTLPFLNFRIMVHTFIN